MSYPNQKFLYIDRHKVQTNQGKFIIIYNEDITMAYKKLNHSAFGVYLYILQQVPHSYDSIKNENNTNEKGLGISPEHIGKVMGMPKISVQRGIKELEDKGYIKCIENSNTYIFRDVLLEDKPQTLEEYEKVKEISLNMALKTLEKEKQEHLEDLAKSYYEKEHKAINQNQEEQIDKLNSNLSKKYSWETEEDYRYRINS